MRCAILMLALMAMAAGSGGCIAEDSPPPEAGDQQVQESMQTDEQLLQIAAQHSEVSAYILENPAHHYEITRLTPVNLTGLAQTYPVIYGNLPNTSLYQIDYTDGRGLLVIVDLENETVVRSFSNTRIVGLLGILALTALLLITPIAAYSGSKDGYYVKLVVPGEYKDTSPEGDYQLTFVASTQMAGFLGTKDGYNINLNLYPSGVGGGYNESGVRLYLVPEQAYISHWCDIPANDPPCFWERLQAAEVPAVTFAGFVVLVGILSAILLRTIRRKR
jgi:hypothetical protein